ncbi:hypothetical protein GCM10027435_27410 [Haloparvum alkalitolerans]|uniref:plastocyanin/azurin family copper-binding protein n=1 Tax=Haloparvum alkalitolerans TaxID=1042953 RepID=UPI003CF009A5
MNADRRDVLVAVGVAGATAVGGCLGTPNGDGTATSDAETPTTEPTETKPNGADPTETEPTTTEPTETEPTETEPTTTEPEGSTAADADETVLVAPDGSLAFEPAELRVAAGTTVAFVWRGGGHNVAVTEQPDGADWAGVPEVQDAGYEYRHTFEVPGAYDYVCEPHEFAGMTGRVVVGDSD